MRRNGQRAETRDEQTQTQKVWEADLGEEARKLTLDELAAMEAMHQCQMLREVLEATRLTTRYLACIDGRLDHLEQYLARIDPRFPRETVTGLFALQAPE